MVEPSTTLHLALRGPAGEPVDFRRTARSHGLTSVAPFAVADDGSWLEAVVRPRSGEPRAVRLTPAGSERCRVDVSGPRLGRTEANALRGTVAGMLALDADLSSFYEAIADDPLLAWARAGAGRIVRSQSVLEDVLRTVCTTNCAFSATRRMIETTVGALGEPALGGVHRAFPTAEQIVAAGPRFFREKARAGYRAEHILAIATQTASGDLDLEQLRPGARPGLSDDDVRTCLLELPGVGPYAAAHSMMLMGRHSEPVLDSWSRPAYTRMTGRAASDRAVARRFSRFGQQAGLAFWLVVTRAWID